MPLTINLPDGRVIALDDNTGSIISETGPVNKADAIPQNDGSDGLPPPPGATASSFDPNTDEVEGVVNVPGGKQIQFRKKDGSFGIAFIPNEESSGGGGVSASTIYSQQQANARDAAGLAEQQRQFNEQFGMDKAKFNMNFVENQRQFNEGQDLERGKTLLGLQNQPGTLYRYLHALGGQLPPQALNGQNPQLPGFKSTYALGQQQPFSPTAPAPSSPVAPSPAATPSVTAAAPGQTFSNIPSNANVALVGGTPISLANGWTADRLQQGLAAAGPSAPAPAPAPQSAPALPGASATSTGYASPYQGESGFNTDGTLRLSANDPDAAGLMAKYPGRYRIGFASGGVIPEPVDGIGRISGEAYEFGEEGPEAVVPNDIFEKLMSKHKGEMSYSEDDGKKKRSIKVNSFAGGGTIGFNPEVFNPSSLPGIVQRGFNSNPAVPLFPDVGIATNGGQSLVPSAQRLNSLLPSQQESFAGFLNDEAGVQATDVFSLAQKLGPQVRGLSTPRYV